MTRTARSLMDRHSATERSTSLGSGDRSCMAARSTRGQPLSLRAPSAGRERTNPSDRQSRDSQDARLSDQRLVRTVRAVRAPSATSAAAKPFGSHRDRSRETSRGNRSRSSSARTSPEGRNDLCKQAGRGWRQVREQHGEGGGGGGCCCGSVSQQEEGGAAPRTTLRHWARCHSLQTPRSDLWSARDSAGST